MAVQPWHELPPAAADALRPILADVADEMIEAVRTIPAYSRPLDGEFGEGVRAGVNGALGHFLAEVEAGGPVDVPTSTARSAAARCAPAAASTRC